MAAAAMDLQGDGNGNGNGDGGALCLPALAVFVAAAFGLKKFVMEGVVGAIAGPGPGSRPAPRGG